MNAIAWRNWSKNVPVFYVESLPGDGGADWGYTTHPAKALPLNKYWQRRFNSDCNKVGAKAQFLIKA